MANNGRSRLTITLRKDLIPFLDQTIDGTKIRNRSHAIEYILGKYLQGPKIRQAVILAGGKGVQMRPLTYEMPKTMIPVHRKPILQHIIESLRDQRIKDITVVIGHLGEMVQDYFKDGSKFGVNITYVKEKQQHGTGGSLRNLKNKINDSFVLIYGDVLSEIGFLEFIDFHKSHNQAVSLALTSQENPTEYGVVNLQGSKIIKFQEKPEMKPGLSHLINTGIYIMEPNIFKYIPSKGYVSLEKDVLPDLAKKGKLYGYPFSGKWFGVATLEIYENVIKQWPKN